MKDAYWFSHDSNAKDDPKIMLMIDQLGLEGYGIYWVLIETLREQPGYRYPLNLLPVLAKRYFTSGEKMKTVVMNYSLFKIQDDEFFFSESLCSRMLHMDSKRDKARLAANKRWQKHLPEQSESNAGAMQTHSDSNASKVKNSKGKKITVKDSKGKKSKKDMPHKAADFIDSVVDCFAEVHGDYEVLNRGKERAAAGKLVKVYKARVPKATSEETLQGLRPYFEKCVNIDDAWLRTNMSLPLIVSKFNEINKLLKNGTGKQISEDERQKLLDRIQASVYDAEA